MKRMLANIKYKIKAQARNDNTSATLSSPYTSKPFQFIHQTETANLIMSTGRHT